MTETPSTSARSVPSTRRAVGVLVVLTVVLWCVIAPSYVVLGSVSMEPWASPGDLLVHDRVPASAIVVDDVVTVPNRDGVLLTQRVVETTDPAAGAVTVRLQGDASPLPDPVPITLTGEVTRVRIVVPLLGAVLRDWGWLLWSGLTLLLLGALALRLQHRFPSATPTLDLPQRELEATGDVTVVGGRAPASEDPRIEALLATCEQLAEDGLSPAVVADLVRVRTCEVLGLPSAERSGAVLALDDGARFYVVALADADPDALAVVPSASARRRTATAALDRWWVAVAGAIPADVRERIAPLLAGGDAVAGQPSDGSMASQPSDGSMASQPSDGSMASQPSDDPMASQPSDDARPPGAGVVVGRA